MSSGADPRNALLRTLSVLTALVVPAALGYVVYSQRSTPAIDCTLDWGTGVILEVAQDSFANYAGLMPGDVIVSINGVPFAEWRSIPVENQPVEVKRGDEYLTLELPVLSLAQVNLPSLLSALAVVVTFWGTGTLLLLRRPQQNQVRILFFLAQALALALVWPLAYPSPSSPPWLLATGSVLGLNLAAPLFLHYCLTFPVELGTAPQRRWALAFAYLLAPVAAISGVSRTPLGVRLSISYAVVVITAALAALIYVYVRRATPDSRRRLRLAFLGTLLAVVPPNLFYLLPSLVGLPRLMPAWVAGLFLLVAPGSYVLAVVRDNLFGIDRLLNRTSVYALLSLGILLLYLGPFLLIYRFLPGDWLAQVFVAAALTLLVGLSLDWTRQRVQRFVDRIFYGGWYDYPGVVEKISDALARSIERAQLTDVLTQQVPTLMQLDGGHLWIDTPNALAHRTATPPQLRFPLIFQNQTRGVWLVGARRDGDDFSDADRRILTTIARQAETALSNVLLVETLRHQLDEIRASRETLAHAQRQLLRSREEERARLARDLHDGPIQDLVGLNMQLGLLLAPDLDLPGLRDLEGLKAMRAEVRELLTDLRQVCAELRPPMLDTMGLGAALRVLADDWSSQNGIAVNLDLAPDARLRTLPDEVAVNLYRLVQEALTNIARHAAARQVTIHLAWEDSHLALTIRDDGRGFVVPGAFHELAAQGHFGLVGMQERVALIGGELSLESAPGMGTTVRVAWQFERA